MYHIPRLTIFRRHLKTCKFAAKGRKHRHCGYPIFVEGTLRGAKIRKSLDLRSREAATRLIREWEVDGPAQNMSVEDACVRFLADVKSRGIGVAQTSKYKFLTRELTREFGSMPVKILSVDDLRKFREGWKLSPISASKKLERLQSFFSFCVESGWIEKNPAKGIKSPKLRQVPTLPYSDAEGEKILWALDAYGEIHAQSSERIRR